MRNAANTAILAVLSAVAIAGVVLLANRLSTAGAIEIATPEPARTAVPRTWAAYITGAVATPGVYEITPGDRLTSLVQAAGGATADAALESVNLAVILSDQDHWHIPRVGETPVPKVSQSTGSPQAAAGVAARININTATVIDLMALPGIGEVKAHAIVVYREANGPFKTVDDLLKVSGIGRATLDAIRELVEACCAGRLSPPESAWYAT